MPEYAWDEKSPIPVSLWGKDHWSTLAYAETCCVDRGGKLNNNRMRTCARRHRKLMGSSMLAGCVDGSSYPTLLADGLTVARHDDWDCIADAVAAGYLVIAGEADRLPNRPFGGAEIRVFLTAQGWEVAAALRAHKSSSGRFADFRIEGAACA